MMARSSQGPGLAGDPQIPAGSRDQAVVDRLRLMADQVRRNGGDVLEQLYRTGILLTPTVVARIRHKALVQLDQDLQRWSPAQFLRRVNKTTAPTAADMHRAILGYVSDYIENEAKNE